jgi:hypothetical protein
VSEADLDKVGGVYTTPTESARLFSEVDRIVTI